MTTYTFQPSSSTQIVYWDNPNTWVGHVVPNAPDADVVFPQTTVVSTGYVYLTEIMLQQNETYSVNSVDITSNYLFVNGSLSVANQITLNSAIDTVLWVNGSVNTGSLVNNGYSIELYGQLTASNLENNSTIDGRGGSINASTFSNSGTLIAGSGTSTITVTHGGFANLTGSTLTGGTYSTTSGATLALNVGSVITTDAANIDINGGFLTSHDDSTGQDIPLPFTLHDIAATGSLTLGKETFDFYNLTVDGKLYLEQNAHITSTDLTITSNGFLQGGGFVDTPVVNDGVIRASVTQGPLTINGPVTGSGHFEILPAPATPQGPDYNSATLEIGTAEGQDIIFDNNIGTLKLDSPSTYSGHITPSGSGDLIVLKGISLNNITSETYSGNATAGTLTLNQANGSVSLNFIGNYNVSSFALSAGPQYLSSDPPLLDITVNGPPCYCAGTMIRTPAGDVAVEHLAVGDMVVTATGKHRPVRWLGHRRVDCRAHRDPRSVWPIRVAKHAFGTGRPFRDLFVSPDHSLGVTCVEEVLVPASRLLNGSTIARHPVDTVTYWHVELDSHDMLLANGMPAESYLDMGNRPFFANTAAVKLHAAPGGEAPTHDAFCRPFVKEGLLLDVTRVLLGDKAERMGWTPSHDVQAHLIVDGVPQDALRAGDTLVFLIPPAARLVLLQSETFVPDDVNARGDLRALGLALRRMAMRGGDGDYRVVALVDERLDTGFHEAEHEGDQAWRWTTGEAVLPPSLWAGMTGTIVLHVDVACDGIRAWRAPKPAETDRPLLRLGAM